MKLNVKERGDHVATYRWICVRLMEMLAAWVPTTPEMEVKLAFGSHLWDMAQHADSFGKRTHELRLPLQHSVAPTQTYVAFVEEVAALQATEQRVSAFYDCLVPSLGRRYGSYLKHVDPLLDGPTVRILQHVKLDLERIGTDHHLLLEELPNVQVADSKWLAAMQHRELALGDVVVAQSASAASAAV